MRPHDADTGAIRHFTEKEILLLTKDLSRTNYEYAVNQKKKDMAKNVQVSKYHFTILMKRSQK